MRKKELETDASKEGLTWQTVILVALLIGVSFWMGMSYESMKTYNPKIEKIESFYLEIISGNTPYVSDYINENTTLKQAYASYNYFKPMSTAVAEHKLRQICSGEGDSNW